MNRFLLVTHSSLATGMIGSLNLIYGDTSAITTYCLNELTKMDEIEVFATTWLSEGKEGDINFIVTDIAIGSTTKACLPLYKQAHLISGVNLPLMLTLLTSQFDQNDVEQQITQCIEECRESLVYLNPMIASTMESEG